jgi:hypothetical protein
VICIIAIGTVFVAGLITRRSWRLYLIIGVCWAVGVFVGNNLAHFPSWIIFFASGHGFMRLMAPSEAVGYFPQQDLLPWLAVFQIFAATLFLVLAAVCQGAKRREWALGSKMLISLVLISVMVCSCTGAIVWRELKKRETGFRSGLQEAERREAIAVKAEMATFPALESYRLAIKMQTAAHYIEGKAIVKLHLADSSDEVFFTLRNYFLVKAVTETGRGKKLKWQRDGSLLTVCVPKCYRQEGTLTLEIFYSGKVWEWFTGVLTRPGGLVNFVTPQFSLLRSGYAWYPIPGIHPLYTRKYYTTPWHCSTLWAERAIHPPTAFDLEVDLDTDKTVVSNLEQTGTKVLTGKYQRRYRFRSLRGRDVFLLAGPYHNEKRSFPGRKGFIDIYRYHSPRERTLEILDVITTPYLFYEKLLQPDCPAAPDVQPSGKIGTVVEIPPFSFLTEEEELDERLALTDTILISEHIFPTETWRLANIADIQANHLDMAVLQLWWPEDITMGVDGRDGNISEGLALYLYTLYMEKKRGRGYYEQVKENVLSGSGVTNGKFIQPLWAKGPVVRNVFMTLDMIRASELGDPAIQKILHLLYQTYISQGSIRSTDFSKTVDGVLARANWHPAKTDEINQRLESIAGHVDHLESRKLGFGAANYTFRPEDWVTLTSYMFR